MAQSFLIIGLYEGKHSDQKTAGGKWLPSYETQTLSTCDDNGNVSQTETKSRREGDTEWQSQTVKTDYDEQGQVTGEYTPRGTKDNVASKYEYNILGQMIRSEIPQEKKDGSIQYQKRTSQYDNTGNIIEKMNRSTVTEQQKPSILMINLEILS